MITIIGSYDLQYFVTKHNQMSEPILQRDETLIF